MATIKVIYCGGWGYYPKYKMLKEELEKLNLGLKFSGEPTDDVTGDFIVFVNDKKVWDKNQGDGDCTKKTVANIVAKVKENLWAFSESIWQFWPEICFMKVNF